MKKKVALLALPTGIVFLTIALLPYTGLLHEESFLFLERYRMRMLIAGSVMVFLSLIYLFTGRFLFLGWRRGGRERAVKEACC